MTRQRCLCAREGGPISLLLLFFPQNGNDHRWQRDWRGSPGAFFVVRRPARANCWDAGIDDPPRSRFYHVKERGPLSNSIMHIATYRNIFLKSSFSTGRLVRTILISDL